MRINQEDVAGTARPRRIVLIADDYGLSPEVDAGILELVDAGRLSGFGCLTQMARWPDAARAIPADLPAVDVGLHLNLTQPFDDAWYRPLSRLIALSYLGGLSRSVIERSFADQIDRFTDAMGRAPDYIDGHQHVHQLPLVRDVLLDLLAERGLRPWLRVTEPVVHDTVNVKTWMIAHLGAPVFRAACQKLDLPTNPAFGGVYGFDKDEAGYLALWDIWLARAPDGALLMCHPGHSAERTLLDPIAMARGVELGVLRSQTFDDLLRHHHRVLSTGQATFT